MIGVHNSNQVHFTWQAKSCIWQIYWQTKKHNCSILAITCKSSSQNVCTLWHALALFNLMSERWLDNLDRSDPMFSSIDRLELLSLSSLTDWINVSNCVASGAIIAFILLSTSLYDNFRSSNCDWRLSSTLINVCITNLNKLPSCCLISFRYD